MQILIRTPEELKNRLREKALQKGLTLNGLIKQILWDWVEKQAKSEN